MRVSPLFSVVVPVRDVAPYLRECLDSLLAQTFGDWEAVCVDDGSTDESGAILDEYASRDGRFRVIHQANAGVCAARNLGIDMSGGEYVTFLDGDDAYEPFWLGSFKEAIDGTGADLVRMRQIVWDGHATRIAYGTRGGLKTYSSDREIADWGFAAYTAEGWSWLNAVRRSCLEGTDRVRFPVGMKLMEDNIFMLQVLRRVRKACQGEVAGYLYRQRPSSASAATRSVQTVARLFDEAAPFFADASKKNRRRLSWMLGGAVLEWRKFRDKTEAGADEVAIDRLVNAGKSSMFSLSSVPARWRLGFAALLSLRTFSVLDSLLRAQRFLFDIRRHPCKQKMKSRFSSFV